jgi:hypothetical protein
VIRFPRFGRLFKDPLEFEVVVHEGESGSRHHVTMKRQTYEQLTVGKCAPERCLEAAFRFLLDREPKESILRRFDVTVISRYFPEFGRELPRYLSQSLPRPCLTGEARRPEGDMVDKFRALLDGRLRFGAKRGGKERPMKGSWRGRRWRYLPRLLLAIPGVVPLCVPLYNRIEPAAAGIPFFYWFQLAWILVSALCVFVVHALEGRGEQEGEAKAGDEL